MIHIVVADGVAYGVAYFDEQSADDQKPNPPVGIINQGHRVNVAVVKQHVAMSHSRY